MLGVRDARPHPASTQVRAGRRRSCEHAFVPSAAAIRFREALATQRLDAVLAAAAELPRIGLDDALEILALLAEAGDPRFERAAVRWLGRLLLETPATLRDARFAVVLVERLPQGLATLHRLARARRGPNG
jgi:HEAT repeat protein